MLDKTTDPLRVTATLSHDTADGGRAGSRTYAGADLPVVEFAGDLTCTVALDDDGEAGRITGEVPAHARHALREIAEQVCADDVRGTAWTIDADGGYEPAEEPASRPTPTWSVGDRVLAEGEWYGTVETVYPDSVGVTPDEDDTAWVELPLKLAERATGVRVVHVRGGLATLWIAGRQSFGLPIDRAADGTVTMRWPSVWAPTAEAIRAALPDEADGGQSLLAELLTDAARDAALAVA